MSHRFPSLIFCCLASLTGSLAADDTSAPAALTMKQVLAAVRAHDPVLASASADARMADSQRVAAYAWDPPQLQYQAMASKVGSLSFVDPMLGQISLSQTLPFPGRTFLAGRVASLEGERRAALTRETEAEEMAQALQAFYDLAAAERLERGLGEVSQATSEMAKTSRQRASFGQLDRMGQFMDTMLAMENSNVDAMLPSVRQQRREAEARIDRLMGEDPEKSLPAADLDLSALVTEPVPGLEAEAAAAEKRNPQLWAARKALEEAKAARALALSGWLPDLSIQGSVTDGQASPSQVGVMLGMSVPWLWFWKQGGQAAAAGAAEDKALQDLNAARLALREQVRTSLGDLQATREALNVTLTRTLPESARGLEQARAGFRTTALGPSEILTAVQDYRSTLQQVSQQISQLGSAQSRLQQLTGAFEGVEGDKP